MRLLFQFGAIFYKNVLIEFHRPFETLFVFVVPACAALILSYVAHIYPQKALYPHETPGSVLPHRVYPEFDFSFHKTIGQLQLPEKVCYYPLNYWTQKLAQEMRDIFEVHNSTVELELVPQKSSEQMNYFLRSKDSVTSACVVFKDVSGLKDKSGKLKYGLKSPHYDLEIWKDKIDTEFEAPSYVQKNIYILKYLVNQAYLNLRAKQLDLPLVPTSNIIMRRLPYPPHTNSVKVWNHFHLALLTCCGYLAAFDVLCYRISKEKLSMSRVMLKVFGLTDEAYWATNIIFGLVPFSVISFIFVFAATVPIFGRPLALELSSPILFFALLTLHSMQLILLGMIICIIFNRTTLVSGLANRAIILGVTAEGFFNLRFSSGFAAIFPSVGLTVGLKTIQQFEGLQKGLTFSTMNQHPEGSRDVTFQHLLLVMLISCLVYLSILWYLDKVWPWQPGIYKLVYFCFAPGHWFPSRLLPVTKCSTMHHDQPDLFEDERPNRPFTIQCNMLSKKWSEGFITSSDIPILDHVDLKIFKGEITCLLGPNGAGKSTLLKLITGLYRPTSGSIIINGFDLAQNTDSARAGMSFCPQENRLYDELTVKQHLKMYALIKQTPLDKLKSEIDKILELVDLTSHVSKFPYELSAGTKRKLCLAIALVNGSDILILDEPSSGLDTEARRVVWDILKRIRRNRTVILVTQNMEEADVLGDRIIILHSGRIVCSGSSFFLKSALQAGYRLCISKGEQFKRQSTFKLIHQYFPEAVVDHDLGSQIIYQLKENEARKLILADFFESLQLNAPDLGISSFGVSASSIKEVFLKINKESEEKFNPPPKKKKKDKSLKSQKIKVDLEIKKQTYQPNFSGQIRALFIKRFNHAKRFWLNILFHIFLPLLLLLVQLMIQQLPNINSVTYNLALYRGTDVYIRTDGSELSDTFKDHFRKVVERTGHVLVEVTDVSHMNQFFINRMAGRTLKQYLDKHVVGLEVMSIDSHLKFTGWTNPDANHALPVLMDLIFSAQLSQLTGSTELILSKGQKDSHALSISIEVLSVALIPLGLSILPALYTLFPIEERRSRAKLIQIMTGLHPMLLHLASFIFDLMLHFFASVIFASALLLLEIGTDFDRTSKNFAAIMVLLMCYGASVIPFAYIWSLLFKSPARGYSYLFQFTSVTAIFFTTVAFVLEFFGNFQLKFRSSVLTMIEVFKVLPVVAVTGGFKKLYANIHLQEICSQFDLTKCPLITQGDEDTSDLPIIFCCPSCQEIASYQHHNCVNWNPFGWSGNRILREVTFMLSSSILFWLILFVIECHYEKLFLVFAQILPFEKSGLEKCKPPEYVDPDVQNEAEYVKSLVETKQTIKEALILADVHKKFGKFFAIKGVSFSVSKNGCFSLIGPNGAGKSILLQMIAAELTPNFGKIFQEKVNQSVDKKTFLQNLGYCPEFNPFIDNLTCSEMIHLYGRLRGIPENILGHLSNQMIDDVGLGPFLDTLTSRLSNGNKRKLSVALSVIGSPKLILLDQTTTGTDPVAREKLYSLLDKCLKKLECCMVLSSNSMSECEALCSRLAILVKGRFVCLGSPQHLKSKFGQGYTVTMKIKRENISNVKYMANLNNRVAKVLTFARMLEHHESLITYQLAPETGSLSQLFSAMERLKNQLKLEDYTLDDATLEQVFIRFLRINK